MSTDTPDSPSFQSGTYKMGGATGSVKKSGDGVTALYTAAPGEQQSYNYLQGRLPALYKGATQSQDFSGYANNYANNQKRQINYDYGNNLNKMKSAFTTSGRMHDSNSFYSGLRPLSDSYFNSVQNVNAQAPIQAQQLRSNDLSYNTNMLNNAQNGISNYYNTGNALLNGASNMSQAGNNFAQQQFENDMMKKQYQNELLRSYLMPSSSSGGSNDSAQMAQMAMMMV